MKLGAVIMIKDFALLNRTIRSVLPVVDHVLVGIDETSTDKAMILDECRIKGASVEFFDFDGFGPVCNRLADMSHRKFQCDWILHLDADEEIDPGCGRQLRNVIEDCGVYGAFALPRRNYTSLDGSRERKDLWPDWQTRLHRHGMRYLWKSHPVMDTALLPAANLLAPMIHHYCFALRTPEEWEQVNRFYGNLLWEDVQEGRIWTGPPECVVPPDPG